MVLRSNREMGRTRQAGEPDCVGEEERAWGRGNLSSGHCKSYATSCRSACCTSGSRWIRWKLIMEESEVGLRRGSQREGPEGESRLWGKSGGKFEGGREGSCPGEPVGVLHPSDEEQSRMGTGRKMRKRVES